MIASTRTKPALRKNQKNIESLGRIGAVSLQASTFAQKSADEKAKAKLTLL